MKRHSYFLLFILMISLSGCPTKKTIPDPKPPEPKVEEQQKSSPAPQSANDVVLDWVDVMEILKGMAPLVGPAPWFFEMTA